MKRLWLLYRKDILISSIITLTIFWGLTATFWAISKSDKLIILYVKDNGDTAVVGENPQILSVESFVRRYIQLLYNYDANSFEENVAKTRDYVSSSVWAQIAKDLKSASPMIKSKKVIQTSSLISKVSMDGPDSYAFLYATDISKDLGNGNVFSESKKLKMKIKVKSVARTLENPWGLEIEDVVEERVL